MARIAYVNGRYRPLAGAAIALEDRGYQFADGVYEVIKVLAGRPRDLERHLDRLERSLAALAIRPPMSRAALSSVLAETLRRNRLRDALLYLQVTRGTAPRNHVYPEAGPADAGRDRAQAELSRRQASASEGVGVITLPDLRWGRCDIKSISLLPNVMARQQAAAAGCREAWLVDQARQRHRGQRVERLHRRPGRAPGDPSARAERILGGVTRAVAAGAGARRRHPGGRAAVLARRGPGGARGGAVQHQLAAAAGDRDRRPDGRQRPSGHGGAAPLALYDAHLQLTVRGRQRRIAVARPPRRA